MVGVAVVDHQWMVHVLAKGAVIVATLLGAMVSIGRPVQIQADARRDAVALAFAQIEIDQRNRQPIAGAPSAPSASWSQTRPPSEVTASRSNVTSTGRGVAAQRMCDDVD